MEVDLDILHAEFQYHLWAIRSNHRHWMCATNTACRPGCRGRIMCQTLMARKEPRYPHRSHRSKSLVTGNELGCFLEHYYGATWLKKTATTNCWEISLYALESCLDSAHAGEQIADNSAEGSNGKWPFEIPHSVYFANNKKAQGK